MREIDKDKSDVDSDRNSIDSDVVRNDENEVLKNIEKIEEKN
jgi:hypothetical protein